MADSTLSQKEKKIVAKVVEESPNLPNMSDDKVLQFSAEVEALLNRRAQSAWVGENSNDVNAVFVYVDYPRAPFQHVDQVLERIIDLPVTSEPVFGKVFFLSFNAGNGTAIPLPCEINSILDWLSDKGLQDQPVVVAHRDTLKFSFRTSSIGNDVTWGQIRDKPAELTISSLKEALRIFHEGQLVTPSMCGPGIWEKSCSASYIPAKDTEKAIQSKLKVALHSYFRGLVTVGTEDSVDKGRIDVRLLAPPDDGDYGLKYWSIIELKVARSFSNTKKRIQKSVVTAEILKGIGQANEFTKDRAVSEGFLEVYDMRKSKDEDLFADAKVKAKIAACTVKINTAVRPMFGSSEDARSAGDI